MRTRSAASRRGGTRNSRGSREREREGKVMAMRVGVAGWRGMVGSVLMQRMQQEGDFALIEPTFFSTSNAGGSAPSIGRTVGALERADDIAALARQDVIV